MTNEEKIFINSCDCLANPIRLNIIKILLNKPSSIVEISKQLDMKYFLIRNHLNKIKRLNIVKYFSRNMFEKQVKITDEYIDILKDLMKIYDKHTTK